MAADPTCPAAIPRLIRWTVAPGRSAVDRLVDTCISGWSPNSTFSRPAICSGEYFCARSASTFARSAGFVTSFAGFAGFGRDARAYANPCAVVARGTAGGAVAGKAEREIVSKAARQAWRMAWRIPVGRPGHDQVMSETRDYQDWHHRYDDPNSGLSWRLELVRRHIGDALDRHPGETRILSLCSGDGRDVLGVLADRDDAGRVSAVLLELHPELAQQARDAAATAGLKQVDVRTVDASRVDAYRGATPADLILMVGVFGNIADADISRLIAFAPQLCRPGATLVWSRGRKFSRELPGVTSGDLNDEVRSQLKAAGFSEVAYETHEGGGRPALGVVDYAGPPVKLRPDQPQLFTFLR